MSDQVSLRRSSRRLDRLNAAAAAVLNEMRAGQCLHLEFFQTGPRWRTSRGRYVTDAVARIVITNEHVNGVGDALFPDGSTSQTFRFVENI